MKGSKDGFDRGEEERKQMCVISASCHGLDFMDNVLKKATSE
jgi:hypothetical protein